MHGEMEIATLSDDDGDHLSAMPAPATGAVRDGDVLRPTEIRLCKSMEPLGAPDSRFGVPVLLRGKAVTKSDFDRHVLTGGARCE